MDKIIICGIYKITSPSGKIYIGQSRDVEKRKKYKVGDKEYKKWIVSVSKGGVRTKAKRFPFTQEGEREAAMYYNKTAIEVHGEDAILNIIEN